MLIRRQLEPIIQKFLNLESLIVILGPRQSGKTTLIKKILTESNKNTLYLNCDEADIRQKLTNPNSTQLQQLFGAHTLIGIDEAQRVQNIGLTLKICTDMLPNIKVIATGSSSFELSNNINEPLTGRKKELHLFPISYHEWHSSITEAFPERQLEERLIFGMYPKIIKQPARQEELLKSIQNDYLYKDIFNFQEVKNPALIDNLLQALALQIGNEVSYRELASHIGIHLETVERYIYLLEQTFVIFRLPPYSKNPRNEICSKRKIYFYDTGIRNAIIRNFNPLHLRNDKGALWENFIISERKKWLHYNNQSPRTYFWRTYAQQEIDYLEDSDGQLHAYEIKWDRTKWHPPKPFTDNYSAQTAIINKNNFENFLK